MFIFAVLFICILFFWISIRSFLYDRGENILFLYKNYKDFLIYIAPKNIKAMVESKKVYENKIESLSLEIERLESELVKERLLKYSQDLQGEISTTIVLHPIMSDITHLYSTIILSKGFKDGISKGDIVYLRGRQSVCNITEVYDQTSTCKLYSSGGEEIEALTVDDKMIKLIGYGGGAMYVDSPYELGIKVGDSIRLRSNPLFILGKVEKVVFYDQASIYRFFIKGEYNPVTSNTFYIDKK